MQLLINFSRFINRFRYPASLPEDVAGDLGIELPNNIDFDELLQRLSCTCPKTLWKKMSRYAAESAFQGSLKKEIFRSSSLFSYYFNQGWVVITLYFDENNSLRRLYVQTPEREGFDLQLS